MEVDTRLWLMPVQYKSTARPGARIKLAILS